MRKIFLTVMVLNAVLFAGNYNPQKAVEYAKRWTIDRYNDGYRCKDPKIHYKNGKVITWACSEKWNPKYTKDHDGVSKYGTDCMSFQSQALHEAGLPVVQGKLTLLSTWTARGVGGNWESDTWAGVTKYKERLMSGYVKSAYKINKYDAKSGDIAFLLNNSGSAHHAVMITKVDNSNIYYTAHTNDRVDAIYSKRNNFEVWRFYNKEIKAKFGTNYGELTSSDQNSQYGHRSSAKADIYKFELKYPGLITFHQHSPNHDLDSWLTLLDSNKRVIVHDDDNDRGIDIEEDIYRRDSVIQRQLSAGTYYLEVSSFGSGDYGRYELKILGQSNMHNYVYPGDVIDDKLTSSSSTSNYRSGRYAKRYLLKIEYGGYYTVKLDMSDRMDAYLYLKKQDNYYLYRDDDDGKHHGMGRHDSYIKKYLSPGVYVIEATTYGRHRTGDFILIIDD